MKQTIRRSQQKIFWRNHKIVELRINKKLIGWFGKRFPKSAQDRIDDE